MTQRLPTRIISVRADQLYIGEIAMIGGRWVMVYDTFTLDDLGRAEREFADDPATLQQITEIITTTVKGDVEGVYVAVHYLWTAVTTGLPGTDHRRSVSPPRAAVAAYSMYDLIDVQTTEGN